MLYEGQGTAERTWFARGLPLSAYVSTNSGEEERRDEIMGPTLSPTLVLWAAGPWGLGFLGTFGAWEPKPRSQGSGSGFGFLLPDYWPHSPQLPLHWNWLLFTLPSSQTALVSHIALNFKITIEINSALLSILKSDPPLCSS